MNTSKLTIVAIIDSTRNQVLGLSSEVSATTKSNGKQRNPNTVIFHLRTLRERVNTSESAAPAMSLADKLRIQAYSADKGVELNADYSEAKNDFVYEFPKSGLKALIGKSYEEITDWNEFLNADANKVFEAFKAEPQRIRVKEIVASTFAGLPESTKTSYQAKRAGAEGAMLTHNGEQIYRTTMIVDASSELEDVILSHEQDLRINKPVETQSSMNVTA